MTSARIVEKEAGSRRLTVVSADGHFGGPIEEYRPYIEAAYRDRMDDLVEEGQVNRAGMGAYRRTLCQPGVYEIAENVVDLGGSVSQRLAALDTEGIAAEILLAGSDHTTPFFMINNKPYPADVREAGLRGYHRWLADVLSEAQGRLLPVGYAGEILDLQASLAELRWMADHGFVSVFVPGYVADPDRPSLFDGHYERFWAACVDLGLVLHVHAGWGLPQGPVFEAFRHICGGQNVVDSGFDLETLGSKVFSMMDGETENSPFALDMGPRQLLWQLMLSGVFDRYPTLKVVLTEVRADWVPATLAHLDQRFEKQGRHLELKPSEYFARNCGVTPSSPHRAEVEARHGIGIDSFMFGADIPHPEATWPNTREWIRHAFRGVPENELRKILGENAIRIYNLDAGRLAGIANRIGPSVAEVFGGIELDQRLVQHFDIRAGYLKPVEQIAVGKIDQRLDVDFQQIRTAGA